MHYKSMTCFRVTHITLEDKSFSGALFFASLWLYSPCFPFNDTFLLWASQTWSSTSCLWSQLLLFWVWILHIVNAGESCSQWWWTSPFPAPPWISWCLVTSLKLFWAISAICGTSPCLSDKGQIFPRQLWHTQQTIQGVCSLLEWLLGRMNRFWIIYSLNQKGLFSFFDI